MWMRAGRGRHWFSTSPRVAYMDGWISVEISWYDRTALLLYSFVRWESHWAEPQTSTVCVWACTCIWLLGWGNEGACLYVRAVNFQLLLHINVICFFSLGASEKVSDSELKSCPLYCQLWCGSAKLLSLRWHVTGCKEIVSVAQVFACINICMQLSRFSGSCHIAVSQSNAANQDLPCNNNTLVCSHIMQC